MLKLNKLNKTIRLFVCWLSSQDFVASCSSRESQIDSPQGPLHALDNGRRIFSPQQSPQHLAYESYSPWRRHPPQSFVKTKHFV